MIFTNTYKKIYEKNITQKFSIIKNGNIFFFLYSGPNRNIEKKNMTSSLKFTKIEVG